MHTLIVVSAVLLCITQVFAYDIPDSVFDKDLTTCMEKFNVGKDFARKHMSEDLFLPEDDTKLNDYLECIAVAKHIFDDKKINVDATKNIGKFIILPVLGKNDASDEYVNKCVTTCDVEYDNDASRTTKLFNCIVKVVKAN
ncbi:hypothetical protein RN001_014326 [Aquatica leii]|uniref:Uncharacterized protein n=1 Tax=Aquatica leii TaxID=1421715 RepID=A0AAN7S7F0_9COLE|nr:hypothetical protein RN001_014326 [Aquatica leii]